MSLGGQAVADRLDRHFATLVDAPAALDENSAAAVEMLTDLLPRTGSARAARRERAFWLRAPFRRLRRLIGL